MAKLTILAACFAISAAMASATTIDYTLTSGEDKITFSLPQAPTPTTCTFQDSCFGTVPADLVVDGTPAGAGSVNFYTSDQMGGLTILDGSTLVVNLGGPVLFSGSLSAPRLLTFTDAALVSYSFGSPELDEPFTLNAAVDPASTPEPAAAFLILAGAGVAGLINRKRMSVRLTKSA